MSVDHASPPVNRRSYNAERRLAQSRRTHSLLLDAALERFTANGYAATSIESIAADAGVSEATIYKTYGGKPGLVRALCRRALEGRGPVPAERRSDALQRDAADARDVVAGWGRLTAEVSPRVAPILLLLRNAADGDPAAAALQVELDADRLARMAHNARYLVRGGHVRKGITVQHATDVLWTYSSPDVFDLLVRRRGWSVRKYARFVGESIAAALLPSV
ncbi:MAG TPA: helix-turn-helix domain-containing protein [Ilumatobacteraceae bacterium]